MDLICRQAWSNLAKIPTPMAISMNEEERERMRRKNIQRLDVTTVQIPYHFRCPISLELMQDPVTISTGQTYDRSSIESWISTSIHSTSTCPVTRSPITDFTLIPNHTLRRLIQQWCVSNLCFGIQRIPTPKQPVDPSVLLSLLNQVSSCCNGIGISCNGLTALRRIRTLCKESEKNITVISGMDARQILLSVVFNHQIGIDLIRESIAILAIYLPLKESDAASIAGDYNRIDYLISLLSDSSFESRVNSAALIESVVSVTRSEMYNADEIYRGIIAILNSAEADPRAVRIGIKTVFALCLVKQHRDMAVAAGAGEAIVRRLADLEKCDSERALATVELLCRIPDGCSVFASHAMTVPMLVKIILKISDRATEYAAGALLSLCSASEICRREAVAAGVWTQLLLLVQSDCTERAKRKAQMLLKLVRDALPEESTALYSDEFGYSDVVLY